MTTTATAKTVTMYRAIPNSETAHPNLLPTREAAEKYLAGHIDGGHIDEVSVEFGRFTARIYHGHLNGGIPLSAAPNGEVRYLGTDGTLHPSFGAQPCPPKTAVKKLLATGKRQNYKTGCYVVMA